jgi:phosphatidylserine/phosphatidylglycerophosphate/cardiolipin synthase-like enzyme
MKTKALSLVIGLIILVTLFNIYKPLPDGTNFEGEIFMVRNSSISFIADKTSFDDIDGRKTDQEIFNEIFSMIDNAENYILIDMFLFNDFQGKEKETTRALSKELTEKLIDKKTKKPEIEITFITDPFNNIYGDTEHQNIKVLKEVGVNVVITDLKKLRDSNPAYSGLWRSFIQFLPTGFIKVPNPFVYESDSIGLDSFLTLLNFKANHRKVIIADYINNAGELKMGSLVTSANPHDGSSAHHNIAIKVDDFIWRDILKTEKAVAEFSGGKVPDPLKEYTDYGGDIKVQLLTEKKIKDSIIYSIDHTGYGDQIKIIMFYLSDRDIINSIKDAYDRGVNVEIILDPNKDAFGRTKNGVPNVSVARELKKLDSDFKIRWCDTHGEQCHSKLLLISKDNITDMYGGSANLTRRNIDNLNLETNIKVTGSVDDVSAINDAYNYFNNLWNNEGGYYTTDYESYSSESLLKYVQYRFMESTGLSSFENYKDLL